MDRPFHIPALHLSKHTDDLIANVIAVIRKVILLIGVK